MIGEENIKKLQTLLEKVFLEGGYDFREYKHGTVIRRLGRRLQATETKTYQEYAQFLDAHPEEYEKFAECVTIKVSGFFRNPYTFNQLAHVVLPDLIKEARERPDRRVRVWSAGCGRGEEAYSIAVLMADFLKDQPEAFGISIFGTDISRQALERAEAGTYSLKDVEGLSGTIIERYFGYLGTAYEVKTEIRRMLHFSEFDLTSTKPSPFKDLDVVFCCNVLIYLQKQLQKRVIEKVLQSLLPQGYLVIGDAETLPTGLERNLRCLDRKARIYRKVE